MEPRLLSETVINELELVEELKSMDDAELVDMGFTELEVKEVKNIDIEEKIRERIKNHTESELKDMGYNSDQLEIMKNFNGEDYQIEALSSTLTLSVYKAASGVSNTYSYLNMLVDWSWNVMPVFTKTDALAFSWSKGYSSGSGSDNLVRYVYLDKTKYKTYNISGKVPGSGCDFKFPLTHPDDARYVGKSGTAHLYLYDNSRISNAEVLVKYGHKYLTGNISVTYPGGVSIVFGSGVNETVKWYNYKE